MAKEAPRRYSQVLYTEEQQAQLKELYQISAAAGRDPDISPQKRVETLSNVYELEMLLFKEARARYRASFNGDYARIMEALHHDIEATTKSEYNTYIKQSREQANKAKAAFMAQQEQVGKSTQDVQEELKRIFTDSDQGLNRFARRNYPGYFRFLESHTSTYKAALLEAGHPIEEYAAALDAAAAKAYSKSPRIIYYQTKPQPRPEWEQVTLEEYIQRLSGQETPAPEPAKILVTEELEAAADPLFITAIQTNILEYPLDKPNSTLWNYLDAAAHAEQSGQIGFAVEKRGSGKEITTYYSINFQAIEGLTVSRVLTPFDKRVYIAAAGLHAAGNNVVTVTQIHAAMGNTTQPNQAQVDKINTSIDKMAYAKITLDNAQEAAAYKKDHLKFVYEGYLLPCERVSAFVNGQLTETAIHLLRVPPLISFAKQRGQITTIPVKLLASPISKTEANLQIEDYLIERISHMKNGNAKNKIRYTTLFETCNISTAKQQERAKKDKIPRFLEYYKQQKFIKSYTTAADGITIIL